MLGMADERQQPQEEWTLPTSVPDIFLVRFYPVVHIMMDNNARKYTIGYSFTPNKVLLEIMMPQMSSLALTCFFSLVLFDSQDILPFCVVI